MIKFYILLLMCLFMYGCALHSVEIKPENVKLLNSTELDILLSQEKDPVLTMDVFADVYGVKYGMCRGGSGFRSSPGPAVPMHIEEGYDYMNVYALTEPDINIKCLVGFFNNEDVVWQDTSDECILHRRWAIYQLRSAKVCWFNYKKYLPEDTKISSGEDFKYATLWYTNRLNDCEQRKERTTEEKEQCKDLLRQFMRHAFAKGIDVFRLVEQSVLEEQAMANEIEKGFKK